MTNIHIALCVYLYRARQLRWLTESVNYTQFSNNGIVQWDIVTEPQVIENEDDRNTV
jgi:hypothetical protein